MTNSLLSKSLHRAVRLLLVIMSTACLTGCVADAGSDAPDTGDVVREGQSLPAFSIALSDGTRVSNESLQGRCAVIVFFQTTCRDCQRELPRLQSVYERELSRKDGARFVCISRAEGQDAIAAYWQAHDLTLPYSPQPDLQVYNLFAHHTIPRVYVADAAGTVRARFVEQVDTDSLSRLIRSL